MIAEIIAVGSEMLTPYRQDTNSLFLTGRLNELGIIVAFKTIVGDNLDHLTSAARTAIGRPMERAGPVAHPGSCWPRSRWRRRACGC